MAMGKTYVVEDADKNAKPKTQPAVFPGTLQGLLDALDAGRYRSAAGTPKAVVILQGRQRQPIRRFENGQEAWSASRAEIVRSSEKLQMCIARATVRPGGRVPRSPPRSARS